MVDELFNAQATIALGASSLYRVDHDDKGHALPAVVETDPKVIQDYIDGKLPHDLRHTAASLAIQSGANVKVVQQMLGTPRQP